MSDWLGNAGNTGEIHFIASSQSFPWSQKLSLQTKIAQLGPKKNSTKKGSALQHSRAGGLVVVSSNCRPVPRILHCCGASMDSLGAASSNAKSTPSAKGLVGGGRRVSSSLVARASDTTRSSQWSLIYIEGKSKSLYHYHNQT